MNSATVAKLANDVSALGEDLRFFIDMLGHESRVLLYSVMLEEFFKFQCPRCGSACICEDLDSR